MRVALFFVVFLGACALSPLPENPTLGPNSMAPRDQAVAWWLTTSGFVAGAVGGASLGLASAAPPEDDGLRAAQISTGAVLSARGAAALGLGIAWVTPKDIGPCEAEGSGFLGPGSGPASGPASWPASTPSSFPSPYTAPTQDDDSGSPSKDAHRSSTSSISR